MLDVNGRELRQADLAELLCEVVSVDEREGVRVRILNSEIELLISCQRDEVLGLVAAAELVRFDTPDLQPAEPGAAAAPVAGSQLQSPDSSPCPTA